MTAQIIRLASRRTLEPELTATHRRFDRLTRARDAALLSLHADLDRECERVALTAGADHSEVRRIEEEIATVRRMPLTRFAP